MMARYIISWNVGFGDEADEVDCQSQEEAEEAAYEAWKEAAESGANYSAVPWNARDAYELGLSDEDPGEED